MKFPFPIMLGIFSLISSISFCQHASKLFELRGRIDVLGNTIIDVLPTKKNKKALSDILEINSIIGQYEGKSIDVLNELLGKGFKLISALYVCSDNSNNYNGNFLIYYLQKEDLK